MTLEAIIGNLLIQHNCVIVPSFGGFVAQRVPAQIDASKGVFSAPRKSVLFNKQLLQNDGLLIASYAQHNETSYSEAIQEVSAVVSTWESNLNSGFRIAIDRVGLLYLDQERNICFEQDRFYNLLMESYGLGPIHFVSASDVEAQQAQTAIKQLVEDAEISPIVSFSPSYIEAVSTTSVAEPVEAPIRSIQPWKYIAAAALLPFAFYSFWIPMKTDVLESGMISLTDFNPFHQKNHPHYQPNLKHHNWSDNEKKSQLEEIPTSVDVYSYSIDDEVYIPVKLKEKIGQLVESPVIEPIESNHNTAIQSTNSHVIVGSFSSLTNANQLATSLREKGYASQVISAAGMYRVSAGSGKQFETLRTQLVAEGLTAWLMK